jgi:hypothetical protein
MAACNLNHSPHVNNVEKCGGLPEEIHSVACHILAGPSPTSESEAIAAGVNFVKDVCKGVAKNFHKRVTHPAKQGRACASVAAWEKLRACMSTVSRNSVKGQGNLEDMDTSAEFTYSFPTADVKAQEDGTLIIEGVASDLDLDRDGEAFLPGALEEGMRAYMERNPLVTYHHNAAKALGRTLEYDFHHPGHEGKLWVKIAVDAPPEGDYSSWHALAYNSIKTGTTKGLSVGGDLHKPVDGFDGPLRAVGIGGGFQRVMTPEGPRIAKADVQEIAITPLPVNPRSYFLVKPQGAAKAMEVIEPNVWPEDEAFKAMIEQVAKLADIIDSLETAVSHRRVSS